ncbi:hypothetical protein GGQ82_003181 [Sphingobium olei]
MKARRVERFPAPTRDRRRLLRLCRRVGLICLLGAADAEATGRESFEPLGRDLLAARRAQAVCSGVEAHERLFDQFDFRERGRLDSIQNLIVFPIDCLLPEIIIERLAKVVLQSLDPGAQFLKPSSEGFAYG